MGFVSAVRDIGRVQIENASVYEDFDWRFLQLPMLPSSDPARTGYVIQVWLAVSDPMAPVLEIQGIERLTIQEYLAGDLPLDEQKRRFCYRAVSYTHLDVYKRQLIGRLKPKRCCLLPIRLTCFHPS